MKFPYHLVLPALCLLSSCWRPLNAAPEGREVRSPQTRQIDFKSKINRQVYRLFISIPESPAPEAGYPVLYLLDGNAMFNTAHEAYRAQQRSLGPAVIVGIGYPTHHLYHARRSTDFLGRAAQSSEPRPGGRPPVDGRRDEFLRIIETEIKPLVEKRHRIDRNRQALFGHSFGGIFTLYALFAQPGTFQTYIAASPSLWWNNGDILQLEKNFAPPAQGTANKLRLYEQVGEWEQRPGGERTRMRVEERAESPERDRTDNRADSNEPAPRQPARSPRRMVDDARDLATRLQNNEALEVAFSVFPEEDHMSVLPIALSRALRFAFTRPGVADAAAPAAQ